MELNVQHNVSLASYTTLGVGGEVEYFVVVRSVKELEAAWKFAEQTSRPPLLLGGGSNMLVADGLLKRTAIKIELKGVQYESCLDGNAEVQVAAGESWDGLVADTVNNGLSGLENLSGVPGTVGAAPVQNINCYGAVVGDVIKSVEVFDGEKKELRVLSAEDCLFDYRDSIFKQPAGAMLVVTKVTFRLVTAGHVNLIYRSASQSIERYLAEKNITHPTPADVREAVLWARNNIGMLAGQYRSAGSFFKNVIVSKEQFNVILRIVETQFSELNKELSPWHWSLSDGREKISTAFLLECSPYNKRTFGKKRWRNVVGLSPKHSLSIVAEPGATAKDVQDFVGMISNSVKETFAVELESEVNFVWR